MKTLGIDIETFSDADIKTVGMYKYVESMFFEILLFAYSVDGGKVEVIDLANGEQLPAEIKVALKDPTVLKTAFNAPFEITCIEKHFGLQLDPSQWECTMAKVALLGLPLSLDQASKALGIEDGKMAEGKKLIRYFCVPCKPTRTNGNRLRNLPEHNPENWELFKQYCGQDVVTEQGVRSKISFFPFPVDEKQIWVLDQLINRTGVLLDPPFIKNAIAFDEAFAEKLTAEAAELTGLNNPNSVQQLKAWMLEETGESVEKLNKETVPLLLKSAGSEVVKRVLELRQQMSKTSVKKYDKMRLAICDDFRIRGIHQYCGANRTKRWAGRLVQPQNLPKNTLPDLDLARRIVASGDLDILEMLFGDVADTISQLIRTSFIAPKGKRLIVSDFSAIEARVIAWLAGEKWRIDVFNGHGKIYEASGAQMFKVPIEQVTKGSTLRDKAKIAELALGYQGGVNALLKMGAKKMGLEEAELKPLVTAWRNANKKIVEYWNIVGDAAIEAVEYGEKVTISHGISFHVKHNVLFIQLPSGGRLSYQSPKLIDGKFGPLLTYMGMDQTTKQWKRLDTYGGKLVENIVQAVARDLLAFAMLQLDKAGYKIVMHVHDEIISEMPYGEGSAEQVAEIMSVGPAWSKGLPLGADAYETEYYRKD